MSRKKQGPKVQELLKEEEVEVVLEQVSEELQSEGAIEAIQESEPVQEAPVEEKNKNKLHEKFHKFN
jgi:hypothetical protein